MGTPLHPDISVIIVNFNAGFYLAQCIQSILAQTYPFVRIIVIDNASKDDSLNSISSFPNIKIICNPANVGFAKAQNQGFRLAQSNLLMPLNFDIILAPSCIEAMVSTMLTSTHIGSVAPKMLRMINGNGPSKQIDNSGLLLPPNRFPFHRGKGEEDHGQYDEPRKVFGAMGAAALYRREMLEDIAFQGQYFDESYFMWYEDIDLEWRAKLRGWDCVYAPEAVAYHVGDPHGHGRSKFGAEISMRNRWKMIITNECSHCFYKNIKFLMMEELMLIRHILKNRLFGSYFRAFASLCASIPSLIKKRNQVRNSAINHCLPDFPLPLL